MRAERLRIPPPCGINLPSKLALVILFVFSISVGNVWADSYTIGWGTASGEAGTYSNFTANSGSVTDILSFSSNANSSSGAPAYNSGSSELRCYYNSGGNGGSITITPASGVTITGFVMTTSTTPAVKYSVNGGNKTTVSVNNSTYTVTGISATSSLEIQNANTTNTQLRIKKIELTYTTSGGSTKCATPSISPEACNFYGSQQVTITTTTTDAAIYYTTNGSAPSKTNGTLYPGSAITVSDATTTVKAIAVKDGLTDSDVASVTYTYAGPAVTSYDIDFESAVAAYVNWTFTNAVIATNGDNSNISARNGTHYGTTGGKSTASIQTKTKIATPGSLTCYVSKQSDNTTSSTWYIQVSSDGSAWTDVESQSATSMTKGNWVEFTADLSAYTNVYVRLYYSGGTAIRNVDDISLEMASAVKKPTITGTTPFIGSTEVTLECTTTGATIYYTTDGTDPKTSGTKLTYSDPFNLTATTTVRAIAELSGDWSSEATSKTFTKIVPLTVAQALVEATGSGKYVEGVITSITEVSISNKNATYVISDIVAGVPQNEMIIYRGKYIDGADFTSADQIHVGDRVVVSGSISQYKSVNQMAQGNQIKSIVAPAVAAPTFTPDGGGFVVSTEVSIACSTASSTVYYTTNGTNPTKSSTEYTAAIPLSATTTIKAIAYVGEESSLVVSKTFTLTAPMTVAEAVEALGTESPINNAAVAGIVYQVDNISGGNATYWISDDGTDTGDVLQIYNGKGLNGADVADNGIRVEDQVIVFGNLTIYGTTKEFASGSRLLSLTRKTVTGVAVTGTPSKTSYKTGEAFDPAGLTVTVTYSDASSTPVDVASCTWEKDPATFTVAGTGKTVSVRATYDEVQSPAFVVEGLTVTEVPTFNNENYEWQLVTSDAQLVANNYYVIGSAGQNKTATTTITSSHLTEVATTISDGVIAFNALGNNTAIFKLGGSADAWTLTEVSADDVLGTTGNKNLSWNAGTQTWTIAVAANGDATIGGESRILHNVNNNFFNTYSSGTSASMLLPQLYVWAEKTYKLRYDANGGEDAPTAQPAVAGSATVTDEQPTYTNKIFVNWNTEIGGTGDPKVAGDVIDLSSADVTLYAQWRDPYDNITISYDANGGTLKEGESAIADATDQVEGSLYTLEANVYEKAGYTFGGWKAYDALDNELTITSNKITVPSTNVTIKAQWISLNITDFILVTNVNQLQNGDKVYIVAAGERNFAAGELSGGILSKLDIQKTMDKQYIVLPDGATAPVEYTVGISGDQLTLQNGTQYLYSTTVKNMGLRNDAFNWTVSITEEGVATLTCSVGGLKYNASSPRFTTYASGQQDIALYKKANYPRAITDGRFGTICLPNSGIMHGAQLFEVAYIDNTQQKIFFDEVEGGVMIAGRPYIFLKSDIANNLGVVYTGSENASAGNYRGLYGSYSEQVLEKEAGNYVLYNNQYLYVASTSTNVKVGANRAYIKIGVEGGVPTSATAPAPGRRRVSMDVVGAPQVTTGVGELNADETPVKVMIDGQLYIIRGEKMYDATGRLVK